MRYEHPNIEQNYPGIRFLVQPVDAAMLKQQIKDLPNAIDETERAGYAREAALMLSQLAKRKESPLAVDSIAAAQASWRRSMQTRPAEPRPRRWVTWLTLMLSAALRTWCLILPGLWRNSQANCHRAHR